MGSFFWFVLGDLCLGVWGWRPNFRVAQGVGPNIGARGLG